MRQFPLILWLLAVMTVAMAHENIQKEENAFVAADNVMVTPQLGNFRAKEPNVAFPS